MTPSTPSRATSRAKRVRRLGGKLGQSGQHRHPAVRRVEDGRHDVTLFGRRQRGVLADRADRDQAVDAVRHQGGRHRAGRVQVEREVGRELRRHGRVNPAPIRLGHR